MNVLFLNQFSFPDQAATAAFLGDVAVSVENASIVCARSSYARGGGGELAGVTDLRVGSLPFTHRKVGKVLSYLSFYFGALWLAFRVGKPDVVVTMTTPPGLAWIGWLLQRFRGSRHVVWEMDLYPDIGVDLGMRWVGWLGPVLDFPRRRADAVIALGECMRARLVARGVPAERLFICENWADGATIRPVAWPAEGPLRILYSGNLGLAHETATIEAVLEELRGDDRFEFVFAGGGPRRAALERACAGMTNVRFLAWAETAADRLGAAHIGLVTQRPETVGSVVPSKTYGIIAAGRPVLYIGPKTATPARVIARHDCGWQFEPGDAAGVVALLERVWADRRIAQDAGARARLAFDANYEKSIGVQRVVAVVRGDKPEADVR